ncbi:SseB family protein [Actinomycetes bacterium KLBMP 9797]
MTTTPAAWLPANDVEHRLHEAALVGDLAEMMRVLAGAPLLVPGFKDSPSESRQRLLTRELDGVPYLLVFTSPEGLHRTVTADGWRVTNLTELAGNTPAGWGLGFNPTTPIVLLVAPDEVPTLVPTAASVADFLPANEVERGLRDALIVPEPDVALALLVTATVIVPTQALTVDGELTVPVFTSPERHDDFLGSHHLDLPTTSMDLVAVLRQWPGPEYRLRVNPGSPIELSLPGERVSKLLQYAVELAQRMRDDPPPPAPPTAARPAPPAPADEPELPWRGDIGDVLRGSG